MNKSNIEWCDLTLNATIGCQHNCARFECYAKALHNRRHELYRQGKKMPEQYAKPFNEIQFFSDRLVKKVPRLPENRNRIAKLISPDKPLVFLGSMSDVMGEFVDIDYINQIIAYTQKNKHANFIFLTKNPKRYTEIHWCDANGEIYDNIILACTIESKDHIDRLEHMRKIASIMPTMVSIEPILSDFKYMDFSCIKTLIVGAATGKSPVKPQWEWVESIYHDNIYYKDNILKHFTKLNEKN